MTKAVRIIALIMAILMGASAIGMIAMYVAAETYDGTSISASLSGAGTEADPYLITNGADLAYFAANPVDGASYKLTNDIVWSSYVKGAEVPAASNWTPIVFKGTFDGNGKTVSGLVTISETNGTGFFAWAEGTVKNLTVKDSYFKGTNRVAGIVGQIEDFADDQKDTDLVRSLVIENCVNYADVICTYKNGYSGGILGGANRANQIDLTISGCVNYGNVTSTLEKDNSFIGGITGQLNGRHILVENCANYGDVISARPGSGGIIAQMGGSSMTADDGTYVKAINCINYGAVSADRICGGITGRLYANATIENCANIGSVTANITGKNAAQYGAIVAVIADGKVVNCAYLDGSATNSGEPDTASGAIVDGAKALADINSNATVTALGDAYALVDGKLTLKVVATAGKVESAEPEVTEPEVTEPVETKPADPVPTGDSAIFYLVIAVLAIAGTAVVAKKREN